MAPDGEGVDRLTERLQLCGDAELRTNGEAGECLTGTSSLVVGLVGAPRGLVLQPLAEPRSPGRRRLGVSFGFPRPRGDLIHDLSRFLSGAQDAVATVPHDAVGHQPRLVAVPPLDTVLHDSPGPAALSHTSSISR